MSNISDIKEASMPFEEKMTWVYAVVSAAVPTVYFTRILGQVGDSSVADIDYQWSLLVAIGVSIVLTIGGAILTAIGTAIGGAISAEVVGKEPVVDIDLKDQRDIDINRRGDLAAYYVTSVGVVGVLALAMLEYEHFWIANALYLSFVVAALVSSGVKLAAYRRGF
jgi:hypothetical protein